MLQFVALKPCLLVGTAIGAVSFFYSIYKQARTLAKLRNFYSNKVVLITGASSGLGKELAIELYDLGARLILVARSLQKLENLSSDLARFPADGRHKPQCIYADLADEQSLSGLAKHIQGPIHVIINNAGISHRGTCQDTTIDVHKQIMQVNHFGQISVTESLLPHLRGGVRDGFVVNIVGVNSVQGLIALPLRSAYSASKHAFKAYLDSLRAELSVSDPKIRVTTFYPGYINTNLSKNALTGSGAIYGKIAQKQGYIKIDTGKLKKDMEKVKQQVTDELGTVQDPWNNASFFVQHHVYLAGGFAAGFLLGLGTA